MKKPDVTRIVWSECDFDGDRLVREPLRDQDQLAQMEAEASEDREFELGPDASVTLGADGSTGVAIQLPQYDCPETEAAALEEAMLTVQLVWKLDVELLPQVIRTWEKVRDDLAARQAAERSLSKRRQLKKAAEMRDVAVRIARERYRQHATRRAAPDLSAASPAVRDLLSNQKIN